MKDEKITIFEKSGRIYNIDEEEKIIKLFSELLAFLLMQKVAYPVRWNSFNANAIRYSIKEKRLWIDRKFKTYPFLKEYVKENVFFIYELAIYLTIKETGLQENEFPLQCPFSFEECIDKYFFPVDNAK